MRVTWSARPIDSAAVRRARATSAAKPAFATCRFRPAHRVLVATLRDDGAVAADVFMFVILFPSFSWPTILTPVLKKTQEERTRAILPGLRQQSLTTRSVLGSFPPSTATAKLVRFLFSAAPLLLPTSADRGCGVWERWVGKMLQGGRSQITPFSNRQILVDRNNFERDKFWWIPPPGLTTKKGRIETARKGRKRPSPRHHPPTAVVEIPQSSITGALHITPVVSLGSTSVKGWQCVSIVVLPSQQRQQ